RSRPAEMRGHRIGGQERAEKPGCPGAGGRSCARQKGSHHGREERRRQHPLNDPASEPRLRHELVVEVKRIRILGDLGKSPHVFVREGLAEARVLPRLEVFDSRERSFAGQEIPSLFRPRSTSPARNARSAYAIRARTANAWPLAGSG